MALRVIVTALALVACNGAMLRSASQVQTQANPIRKVVTLLQAMQKKVTEEGEKEKELYEKFMCYCKTGGSDLSAAIAAAEAKGPQVTSAIEAGEGKLAQSKADLRQAQVDRSAAKDAIAAATALREKEAAAYASTKAEYDTNIAAVKKAVTSLEKGMSGSFLQTPTAQKLRSIVENRQDMIEADQQDILSFLSGAQSSGYAPSSGEVTGILKQMGDTMEASLKDATTAENEAVASFEGLVAAKTKEIEALTASIESKTTQIGELGVELVAMKEDLDDSAKGLLQDKKFLAELEHGCATKTGEWEERSKVRSEELVALADTIKMLNDDDALDLFKKTLPSASSSLLQVKESGSAMRNSALNDIHAVMKGLSKKDKVGLQLIALALSGKKALSTGGFDKVVKMIDDMVALLKTEQLDDDHKKEYCEAQFDQADDKKKGLERSVSDLEKAIASAKEGIATATEETASLEAGIKELDKSVAEATENRKEENVEYKELMASDTAAEELLAIAKNRLNKFYNPKLYKPPAKVELSAEDKIVENMSFLQLSKGAPPPPPETFGAYTKKSEESSGVIAMIDMLVADLDKEMTTATAEEKNAQADYEEMMSDSAEKRATDLKTLSDKTSAKADMEVELESATAGKASTTKELMATLEYIQSLHGECDWLVQYYDVRKEARAGEVDALTKAKAVLNGADYSLLQILRRAF
jgi:chromosome segregation ATPase